MSKGLGNAKYCRSFVRRVHGVPRVPGTTLASGDKPSRSLRPGREQAAAGTQVTGVASRCRSGGGVGAPPGGHGATVTCDHGSSDEQPQSRAPGSSGPRPRRPPSSAVPGRQWWLLGTQVTRGRPGASCCSPTLVPEECWPHSSRASVSPPGQWPSWYKWPPGGS